jgi:hypothetical protein
MSFHWYKMIPGKWGGSFYAEEKYILIQNTDHIPIARRKRHFILSENCFLNCLNNQDCNSFDFPTRLKEYGTYFFWEKVYLPFPSQNSQWSLAPKIDTGPRSRLNAGLAINW